MADRTDLFFPPEQVSPAQPPQRWSYSSFNAAKTCPRRWSLERSEFELPWGQSVGRYPRTVYFGTLRGTVIHESIDALATTLREERVSSLSDPQARAVLCDLGGLSAVVGRIADEELVKLSNNPRAKPHLDRFAVALRRDLREVAAEVKRAMLRTSMHPVPEPSERAKSNSEPTGDEGGLRDGAWSEVELRPSDFPWRGIVDQIKINGDNVAISDYKTGQPDASHRDQLELYALLWREDASKNPTRTRARSLRVLYTGSGRAEEFPAPTEEELDELKRRLNKGVAEVTKSIESAPAPAKPSADACRFCSVRQLCPEYWQGNVERSDDSTRSVDLHVALLDSVSSDLWDVSVLTCDTIPSGSVARMRVPEDYSAKLSQGMKVLALNYDVVGLEADEDGSRLGEGGFLSPTANSELYAP